MIKNCSLALLVLATGLFTSPCFAAYDGFYFGIAGGAANTHYKASNINDVTSAEIDNTGFGGRVYGGYQWTRNWAGELSYTWYPTTSFNNINGTGAHGSISENATDLILKAMLPLGCKFAVYAKAGVAYVNADRNGFLPQKDQSGFCPTYGGGFSYDVNPNVPIVVTWMRVQESNPMANADLLSLGIEYHFG